jgi:oxygen-independent coproporphyrinogen-3 oxidase
MLGLYLHIPFCQAICSYCNFNRGLLDENLKHRYVAALEREIRTSTLPFDAVSIPGADSIFFGGGTPSLLAPAEVERLIESCRDRFSVTSDAEITLETNPETATRDRLEGFRRAGVTRISFGVQSFEDEELGRLGRIHNAARAREAVRDALDVGFASVSLDLMLWLPGQSFSSWLRTVDEAVALGTHHLSFYLLELYPNAPLRETMAREAWSQTPDDEAADMYLAGLDRFDSGGFAQYEISNTARPGHESRHNLKYWESGDWWGFGCGAHSTVAGHRWRNVSATTDYVARVQDGQPVRETARQLSRQERFEEAVFTGLRLTRGVDGRELHARFGVDPWVAHEPALLPYLDEGLLWKTGSRLGLTRRGMLVANDILATFV